MQIVGKIHFKEVEQLLAEHGLNDGGEVQKFIDNEVMRQSLPYMPNMNGVLQNAMMSVSYTHLDVYKRQAVDRRNRKLFRR